MTGFFIALLLKFMNSVKLSFLSYLAPLLIFLLLFAGIAEARKSHHQDDDFGVWLHRNTASFDYYLLALSWSPAFCNTPAGRQPGKHLQCTASLGFVVHGLWPQYNNNDYPHDCGPEADVSAPIAAIAQQNTGLAMPPGDVQLFKHEWSKHGTCSGLNMTDYFTAIKTSAEKVKIPEPLKAPHNRLMLDANAIVGAFVAVNPGLTPDMINIDVDHQGNVSGVQICFSKQLSFQNCTGAHTLKGGVFLPVN